MNRHNIDAGASTWNNSSIIAAYKERISYDANGNILKYLRQGGDTTGLPLDMDSLGYKYNRDVNGNLVNNRLNHVRDAVNSSNYTVDIDDQSANNYTYDRIGNLVSDAAEHLDEVRWTVYGKINRIVKTNGGNTTIDYGYDPGGNRTYKKVNTNDTITNTFYVRDAQGNVLAIYSKKDEDGLKWDEQHLYGSSRLGMWRWDTLVPTAAPVVGGATSIYDSLLLGSRAYELSNHLGNVLSTISDKKIGNDSSGTVNYYIAEVLSQNDYYPFGMMMPGRKYTAESGYRYGFNGKENDNDVKGEGNQQDYGMRIYDPRLGKFLSVDPLFKGFPWYSPYHSAGNNPIKNIDLDGGEPLDYVQNWISKTMIINDKRRVDVEVAADATYRSYSYEAVYDEVTDQHWFIMRYPNNPTYYYWKHIDGADPNRLIQSRTGKLDNGTWERFETQNSKQAKIGAEVADGLGMLFYALFTAPFVIETAVNVAPSVVSAASTTANVARVAFRNFAKPFVEEFAKELIGNGGDITKVDFFDVLSNTAVSKFKLNLGQKEFFELLNSGFDFTIEEGGSDVFGISGDKKSQLEAGVDMLFSQLSVFGSETLDKNTSKLLDIFIEKTKNELNEKIKEINSTKKANDN